MGQATACLFCPGSARGGHSGCYIRAVLLESFSAMVPSPVSLAFFRAYLCYLYFFFLVLINPKFNSRVQSWVLVLDSRQSNIGAPGSFFFFDLSSFGIHLLSLVPFCVCRANHRPFLSRFLSESTRTAFLPLSFPVLFPCPLFQFSLSRPRFFFFHIPPTTENTSANIIHIATLRLCRWFFSPIIKHPFRLFFFPLWSRRSSLPLLSQLFKFSPSHSFCLRQSYDNTSDSRLL